MHNSPSTTLELSGVTKRYGTRTVLANLDLVVPRGTIVGLVGPNGTGKSTALKIAVGLIKPDAGRVTILGNAQPTIDARASCAFVPDDPGGLDDLLVRDVLRLSAGLYGGGDERVLRSMQLLDALGLGGHTRTSMRALSHGSRRLVSLVVGLSAHTPFLVLDEATAALDPQAVVLLRRALTAIANAGTGVLLASQSLDFAAKACDVVALLHEGGIVAMGSPSELLRVHGCESLEDVFVALVLGEEMGSRVDALLSADR